MGVAVAGGFRNAGASLPAMAPFPVAAHPVGPKAGAVATGSGSRSWPEAFAIIRCLSPPLNSVSSFRHVVRSMRISRTTHSCPLHAKGYATYQTGSAFNRSCFIQPPPTPPLPAEPYASAFALAYRGY